MFDPAALMTAFLRHRRMFCHHGDDRSFSRMHSFAESKEVRFTTRTFFCEKCQLARFPPSLKFSPGLIHVSN